MIGSKGVDLTLLFGDIKEDWGSAGRKSPSGTNAEGGLVDERSRTPEA